MRWRFWEPDPAIAKLAAEFREAKDETVAALRRLAEAYEWFAVQTDRHDRQTVADAARYAELLTKYHQLKLQGFTPEPVASKPEKPSRDPVMEAVSRACAGKGELVLQSALRQVKIDREAKLSDEEIILRIQRGNRPADEFQ